MNLVIFINWLEFCRSFGFEDDLIWPAQHPIMVIMLLYGGATEPIEEIVKMLRNAVNKATEVRAGMCFLLHNHDPLESNVTQIISQPIIHMATS